jgi:hypothetical protein
MEIIQEITIDNSAYRVKSVLPENILLQDILLRLALDEAVKQPIETH